MRVHELKTDGEMWDALDLVAKRAEVRFNDRDYQVGDILRLVRQEAGTVDRDAALYRKVTHVLPGGQYGIEFGHVLLSLALCSIREEQDARESLGVPA